MGTTNLWKGAVPESNVKIWRYMDFTKLTSLLHKKALFFSRADNLGDPFEGSFPKPNVEKRRNFLNKVVIDEAESKNLGSFYKLFVKLTVVSCWHINEYESDAMWKLYLQNGDGIAIQSTVGRLIGSLKAHTRDPINVFKVEYADYEKVRIPEGTLSPYYHKRKSFEHEKELRAVIQRFSYKKNNEIDFNKTPFSDGGIYVTVNIDSLVESIFLSPTCPAWQKDTLNSLVRKYGLIRNIKQSKLTEAPIY